MRCNVDLLKLIQLGITLFSKDGDIVPPNALARTGAANTVTPCTWEFNFKFSLDDDMYAEESINLLKKAGQDFDKHQRDGIDVHLFASLLITSGLTFNDDVYWVSFHSGYDFGYIMKLMWCRLLPTNETEYRRLVKKFFPNIYDAKFLIKHAQRLRDRGTVSSAVANALEGIGQKSGLSDIAAELRCSRVGAAHTAGSDAWLTGLVFFEVKKRLFDNNIPEELNGQMWGITGIGPPASTQAQAAALQLQSQQAAANGMMAGSSYHGHHREGAPTTPTTNPAGLVSTPNQGGYQGSSMTPGAGGVFGNFQYGK